MESDVITLQELFEFKIERGHRRPHGGRRARSTGPAADLPAQVREARHRRCRSACSPTAHRRRPTLAETAARDEAPARTRSRRSLIAPRSAPPAWPPARRRELAHACRPAQRPSRSRVRRSAAARNAARRRTTSRCARTGPACAGLDLIPATATDARQFGVVLVIDASSEHARPAASRRSAAARTFASSDGRQPAGRGRDFNHAADGDRSRFTTDAAQIDAGPGGPPQRWSCGTHIYDAVDHCAADCSRPRRSAPARSSCSRTAPTPAATSGRQEGRSRGADGRDVRIFTVGLRSTAFDSAALRAARRSRRARYTEADSPRRAAGDLRPARRDSSPTSTCSLPVTASPARRRSRSRSRSTA